MATTSRSDAKPSLKTRLLGSSSLCVTEACLGTMTWGVQNSEADAHAQLDYAIKERGITMVDTAELYPVPLTSPEWRAGRTEEFIGTWLAANPEWREKIVLATKVCGYQRHSRVAAARDAPPATELTNGEHNPDCRLDRASIHAACHASLKRLQTDYIDLYQLHWPDRYVPIFGATVYRFDQERRDTVPIEETAAALKELLDEGKIRAYGLSNETPYGVGEWARVAAMLGMPPPATIQNAYSLLCRSFETELGEACAPRHHNVGLLPWSVLAGGLLSGKYQGDAAACEPSARFLRFDDYMSRWHPKHARAETLAAAAAYSEIAAKAGLSPSELAILWCRTRRFVAAHGSVIIGATTLEQLKHNLDAFLLPTARLTEETERAIDEVHMRCRDPSNGL